MTDRSAPGPVAAPPRMSAGVAGWARANLFSSWHDSLLTLVSCAALALALWFGLGWVFRDADWSIVATIGGRFVIGNYNSDQACPGNDCFWRPQVALLMVTALLGLGRLTIGVIQGNLRSRDYGVL